MATVDTKSGFKLIIPDGGSTTAAIYSHGDGTKPDRLDPVGGVDLKYYVKHGVDNDAGNIDLYSGASESPEDENGKWYDYNLSGIGEVQSDQAVQELGEWADSNKVTIALVTGSTSTGDVLSALSGYSTVRALNCRPD